MIAAFLLRAYKRHHIAQRVERMRLELERIEAETLDFREAQIAKSLIPKLAQGIVDDEGRRLLIGNGCTFWQKKTESETRQQTADFDAEFCCEHPLLEGIIWDALGGFDDFTPIAGVNAWAQWDSLLERYGVAMVAAVSESLPWWDLSRIHGKTLGLMSHRARCLASPDLHLTTFIIVEIECKSLEREIFYHLRGEEDPQITRIRELHRKHAPQRDLPEQL